jgi:hypothetical protein
MNERGDQPENIGSHNLRKLYNEIVELENKKSENSKEIPKILTHSILILVISLVGLFGVRSSNLNNEILFWIGVLLTGFSIYFLIYLRRFVLKLLD